MAGDNNGRIHIGWAREDRAHDTLVKTLARRVVIEGASWDIADDLENMWIWAGPSGEPDFKIGAVIDFSKLGVRRIRLHGKLGGQTLAPEARMYRQLLLAFELATPRPQLAIIARDGDGRVDERPAFRSSSPCRSPRAKRGSSAGSSRRIPSSTPRSPSFEIV